LIGGAEKLNKDRALWVSRCCFYYSFLFRRIIYKNQKE